LPSFEISLTDASKTPALRRPVTIESRTPPIGAEESLLRKEERMTLQEKLDSMRKRAEGKMPAEVVAIMHRATDDLRRSGTLGRVLQPDEKAPNFSLPNTTGTIIRSAELLHAGAARRELLPGRLVTAFFRPHGQKLECVPPRGASPDLAVDEKL
jgi:hypothetical protein